MSGVQWIDWLPACYRCGGKAVAIVRGQQNQSFGYTCKRCAEWRLKRDEQEREKVPRECGE